MNIQIPLHKHKDMLIAAKKTKRNWWSIVKANATRSSMGRARWLIEQFSVSLVCLLF